MERSVGTTTHDWAPVRIGLNDNAGSAPSPRDCVSRLAARKARAFSFVNFSFYDESQNLEKKIGEALPRRLCPLKGQSDRVPDHVVELNPYSGVGGRGIQFWGSRIGGCCEARLPRYGTAANWFILSAVDLKAEKLLKS